MNKLYLTLMMGMTCLAQQDHINELKNAIETADAAKVTEITKDLKSLPQEGKKILLAHAQKWANYRKTIITKESRITSNIGLYLIYNGAIPLALCSSSFFRNLIKRDRQLPLLLGSLSTFFFFYGGLIYWIGRRNQNMGCIEQRSLSIIKLIKNIKTEDVS